MTGRSYKLFEYTGAPDAKYVTIIMGSGGETVVETVNALNAAGAKVGVLQVRLYRPFSASYFVNALPATTECIACLLYTSICV